MVHLWVGPAIPLLLHPRRPQLLTPHFSVSLLSHTGLSLFIYFFRVYSHPRTGPRSALPTAVSPITGDTAAEL